MKYYIVAGEASGDLHGSHLIRAISQQDPSALIRAWGGDQMENAGATVVKHYRELAFMGFVEVLKNLPAIARNFAFCKQDIARFQPDVLVLIDYPGFNLRMAKWAKTNAIRVFYYISPQLWAWKEGRVRIIAHCVERLYVILPFEPAFYQKHGVEVDYAGHPLVDVVATHQINPGFFENNDLSPHKPIVALLPGSRRQEISRMLDGMLSVVPHFPEHQFVVAGAPSIGLSFYREFLKKHPSVRLVENQTYDLLQSAAAALVTSGTATLETALFGVPQVVCYAGNWVSYQLAKRLVNKDLQYIAMPNLIAGQQVVAELIQADFNTTSLQKELAFCLSAYGRAAILKGYQLIQSKLNQGGASEKVGRLMVERLREPRIGF